MVVEEDFLILGIDLGQEMTISSLLIVEDMGDGDSWEETEDVG